MNTSGYDCILYFIVLKIDLSERMNFCFGRRWPMDLIILLIAFFINLTVFREISDIELTSEKEKEKK